MRRIRTATKEFVRDHTGSIAVVASLATVIALQHSGIKSLNAFLAEKGLIEEYYTPS